MGLLQSSGLNCSLTYNSWTSLALPLTRKTTKKALKIFKIVDLESEGFSFMYVRSSNLSLDAICEVLTAVLLNIQFSWNVTLRHSASVPDVPRDCSAFILSDKPSNILLDRLYSR
jgi:hypothetical protein